MAHRLKSLNEPLFRQRFCDGLPRDAFLSSVMTGADEDACFFAGLCDFSWHLHLLMTHTPAIQPHVSVAKAGISWLSST
jgi:hypothetical protein